MRRRVSMFRLWGATPRLSRMYPVAKSPVARRRTRPSLVITNRNSTPEVVLALTRPTSVAPRALIFAISLPPVRPVGGREGGGPPAAVVVAAHRQVVQPLADRRCCCLALALGQPLHHLLGRQQHLAGQLALRLASRCGSGALGPGRGGRGGRRRLALWPGLAPDGASASGLLGVARRGLRLYDGHDRPGLQGIAVLVPADRRRERDQVAAGA